MGYVRWEGIPEKGLQHTRDEPVFLLWMFSVVLIFDQ